MNTLKFYQLPQGRIFKVVEGNRILTAVKVGDTDVSSDLGVTMYVGNSVLLEENGIPTKTAGEIMLLAENQEIMRVM